MRENTPLPPILSRLLRHRQRHDLDTRSLRRPTLHLIPELGLREELRVVIIGRGLGEGLQGELPTDAPGAVDDAVAVVVEHGAVAVTRQRDALAVALRDEAAAVVLREAPIALGVHDDDAAALLLQIVQA